MPVVTLPQIAAAQVRRLVKYTPSTKAKDEDHDVHPALNRHANEPARPAPVELMRGTCARRPTSSRTFPVLLLRFVVNRLVEEGHTKCLLPKF